MRERTQHSFATGAMTFVQQNHAVSEVQTTHASYAVGRKRNEPSEKDPRDNTGGGTGAQH